MEDPRKVQWESNGPGRPAHCPDGGDHEPGSPEEVGRSRCRRCGHWIEQYPWQEDPEDALTASRIDDLVEATPTQGGPVFVPADPGSVLSRAVLDELSRRAVGEALKKGGFWWNRKQACFVELRPAKSIEKCLSVGIFVEKDGKVWNAYGHEVIEMPFASPLLKNHPPKPETAFWRGAPRRKR